MSGKRGVPHPCLSSGQEPHDTSLSKGIWKQWGAAVWAQCFGGKLRGWWEEWRECDKATGGFCKGRGRNEHEKGGGMGSPVVPLSTVSQFPLTGGKFDSLSWNIRELRGMPVAFMDEADTLISVPSAIPNSKNRGQHAASSHSSWPPATLEIASLCCHCPCVCRWFGPTNDESQWKSVTYCRYSCEDSTGPQDHTVALCGCGAAGFWRSSSSAPPLLVRSGVMFLAPALTQVSAHSYQQALQVALHVCPLEIEIFLNSEPPWPLSSYASLCWWQIALINLYLTFLAMSWLQWLTTVRIQEKKAIWENPPRCKCTSESFNTFAIPTCKLMIWELWGINITQALYLNTWTFTDI